MTRLEEVVREAWANAWNDGYEDFLRNESVENIAIDMMNCDEEVNLLSSAYTDEEDIKSVENIVKQLKKEYGYELESYGYVTDYALDLETCRSCGYPAGTLMVFLNENGYDHERKYANDVIGENMIVTVKKCHIGGWASRYEFVEFPGKVFNTVMFEKYSSDA